MMAQQANQIGMEQTSSSTNPGINPYPAVDTIPNPNLTTTVSMNANPNPAPGFNSIPAPQSPFVNLTSNTDNNGNYSQEQLWELVKGKEAMIHTLQQKLSYYRTWLSGVHARVQQMSPNLIKNARRLYIGGLDESFTDEELLRNTIADYMLSRGGCTHPGQPIIGCKITPEKGYAFMEFRSVEEATNALAFDGVLFQGVHLKIRRPSNYDPASALMLGPTIPDPTVDNNSLDICRSVVEDTPNKLFVGGLPCDWTEDQVKELLIPLGSLKSFNLVMDKVTGKSKGYAFCQFDEGSTDYVIAALNQKKVGNKMLTVKRALEGQKVPSSNVLMPNGMAAPNMELSGPMKSGQLMQTTSSNLMATMFSGMHGKSGGSEGNSQMGQGGFGKGDEGMLLKQGGHFGSGGYKQMSNSRSLSGGVNGIHQHPNQMPQHMNSGPPMNISGSGANNARW
eukprot:TRINITY_DN4569_c0_g2_i1.p1 TRINITY_DN4569_c0_g2~~TRINITY_DN4569_c0_g2_i1.p1  ORF type:complete len:450 (-),score=73.72 TRINITY_DN4569_c0_g2_i1:1166-2515(-)